MLRFAVQDEHGPADAWPLVNAHLLGPEDLAIPGRVGFERHHIVCRARGSSPCALCLLYDAPPTGRFMLQTCLLPDRDEPYLLSLELARHRIKMFLARSEEWQMFDLDAAHPASVLWEQARGLFTKALLAENQLEADQFARRALADAIAATERLAMAHAEILLHRRYGARAASSVTLGVRVCPRRESKALKELIAREFDVVVLPLRWSELEVEEGRYQWDLLDRWMHWAKETGKPIVAGPLLDFSSRSLPPWMRIWQHDFDAVRDLAFDHVERVVQRYASMVGIWNVGTGLNVNEQFRFTTEQMVDLARMASLLVKQSRKGGRAMIDLAQPFGEHGADDNESLHSMAFVDRLIQEGVKLDAIGVQLLFGQAAAGRATRDLAQISALLDRFLPLDLPVLVSAAGVPSRTLEPDGGHWHAAWSPEGQSRWIARLLAIALSKPFVESVFWAELYDHPDSELPASGLVSDAGKAKPALARLVNMRKRLRRPLGLLRTTTSAASAQASADGGD